MNNQRLKLAGSVVGLSILLALASSARVQGTYNAQILNLAGTTFTTMPRSPTWSGNNEAAEAHSGRWRLPSVGSVPQSPGTITRAAPTGAPNGWRIDWGDMPDDTPPDNDFDDLILIVRSVPEWFKWDDNPVVSIGPPGAWDGHNTTDPTVLRRDRLYHMWYAGQSDDYRYQVGYATSPDGITWQKHDQNPVFHPGPQGSWDSERVAGPTVLYHNGEYRMWYHASDQRTGPLRGGIGYATSADGITWTRQANGPVLESGPSGAWDDDRVRDPTVIWHNNAFHMWYTGDDGSHTRIGYATSPDGVDWTKYAGNPVLDLGSSGSWDDEHVWAPEVVFRENRFFIWYSGLSGEWYGVGGIGMAESSDGVHWTKSQRNPIIQVGQTGNWDDGRLSHPTVVTNANRFVLFYAGWHDTGQWGTEQVGLALGPKPLLTYSISGHVRDGSGDPIADVTISTDAGASTTTGATGAYTITGLITGTYTLTPSKPGWKFTPPSRTVSVPPDATRQDFVAMLAPDLRVDHIEVSQVLLTDTVPLIAEKLTLVRVYVGVSGADSVGDVTARLYVQDAQGQVHVVNRTYNNPITAKVAPDPHNLNDTVNFLPQVSWLTGTVRFWAEVDPDNQVQETIEDNNVGGYITRTFEAGQRLRIAWVPMTYAEPGPIFSLAYPDERIAREATAFLEKILPLGIDDLEYFRQPTHISLLMRVLFSRTHAVEYLRHLNRYWELTTRRNGWHGGRAPDRLFGWVPREAEPGVCGIADARFAGRNGRVAAGVAVDFCADNRRRPIELTFAHEVGHLLDEHGLQHAPSNASNPHCYEWPGDLSDYPYPRYDPSWPQGTIGAWGTDVLSNMLLSPEETYDFMSFCVPKWVSPFHYNRLSGGFPPMDVEISMDRSVARPELLASGIVYTPALTVTFDTFYPITSTVLPDDSTGTAYCLELRSATESVLDHRCFDLSFTNPETGGSVSAAGFTLALPYPRDTQSVVLRHLDTELGRVTASENPPTVRLRSGDGQSWGASGTYTVTWAADDLDGDPLSFIVSYSPDGGHAWMPLALDLTTPYLAIESGNLPGTANALIKVEASDQMHAAEDVSDAPFAVERKGPEVHISSPRKGVTIASGALLVLQGYAYDLEDGTLTDGDLSWMSSRDGDLGTGRLVFASLSRGQHIITLTATDRDGKTATASVSVYVGSRVFLPVVFRKQ